MSKSRTGTVMSILELTLELKQRFEKIEKRLYALEHRYDSYSLSAVHNPPLANESPVGLGTLAPLNDCTVTKVCHWSVDDEETSTWSGACGVVWHFPDGATPKESELHYCPRCGGIVLVDNCPVMSEPQAGEEQK